MTVSKAAASEDRRRSIITRPTPSCWNSSFPVWGYVEGLNDARTPLAGFFSFLPGLCG